MAESSETVLVTGGTGFLGGWCVASLLDRGYEVVMFDPSAGLIGLAAKRVRPGLPLTFHRFLYTSH